VARHSNRVETEEDSASELVEDATDLAEELKVKYVRKKARIESRYKTAVGMLDKVTGKKEPRVPVTVLPYPETRNIYNIEELRSFIQRLGETKLKQTPTLGAENSGELLQHWLDTVAYNYCLQHSDTEYFAVVPDGFKGKVKLESEDADDYLEVKVLPRSEAKEWAQKKLDGLDEPRILVLMNAETSGEHKDMLLHIADWILSGDKVPTSKEQITKVTVEAAVDHAEEWVARMNAKQESEQDMREVRVLYTFDDGYKLVQLVTENSFIREGKLLRHCIGNGNYYTTYKRNPKSIFLSLRDTDNFPCVSVQTSLASHHEGTLVYFKEGKLEVDEPCKILRAEQVSSFANQGIGKYLPYLIRVEELGICEGLVRIYKEKVERESDNGRRIQRELEELRAEETLNKKKKKRLSRDDDDDDDEDAEEREERPQAVRRRVKDEDEDECSFDNDEGEAEKNSNDF
jgi:hypothetical protein